MGEAQTPHKWYKIVYSQGENSPNFEDNFEGRSANEAIQGLRYQKERLGRGPIKILYVWQNVDPSEYTDSKNWERNVQFMRVEFPRLDDAKQDEEASVLAKVVTEFLQQRFLGTGTNTTGVVSLGGFYRGDRDWDNIDQDGCVNYPDRGKGDNEP